MGFHMSIGRDGMRRALPAITSVARAGGTAVVFLLTAVSAKAAVLVAERPGPSQSIEQRVAAIRAKAAELAKRDASAASPEAAAERSSDQHPQIAWNNWRNS
jgi:hypothetical protein